MIIPAPTASAAAPALHSGHVAWYSQDKQFGFLTDEDSARPSTPQYFVGASSFEGFTELHVGDHVAYELVSGSKGPQAAAVRMLHCVATA